MLISNDRLSQVLGMNCGIYKITNTVNGKCYVGSSVDVDRRIQVHKSQLKNNKHDNPKLQRSYNKHGKDCFTYEIIELCEKRNLRKIEQEWILHFNSFRGGYNQTDNTTCPNPEGVEYELVNPDGEIVRGKNLKLLSQQIGIRYSSSLHGVIKGEIFSCKGWRKVSSESIGVKYDISITNNKKRLAKAQNYKFVSPEGKVFEGDNLRLFSNQNGLERDMMKHLRNGRVKQHRGWRNFSKEIVGTKYMPPPPAFTYEFIDPNGNYIKCHNITELAKHNSLNVPSLSMLARGHISHHKGWKKFSKENI